MIGIVREKLPEIEALCKRYGVARLDLFGSAAREDDFDSQTSDVDLVVSFGSLEDAASYPKLHQSLESVLQRDVDLLDRRSIRNPVIRKAILEEKVVLYAA